MDRESVQRGGRHVRSSDLEYKSYGTLDLKLLEGMVNLLEKAGERARMLRETINHERLDVAKTGVRLRGRQAVRLFMKSFRTFGNSEITGLAFSGFPLPVRSPILFLVFCPLWHFSPCKFICQKISGSAKL